MRAVRGCSRPLRRLTAGGSGAHDHRTHNAAAECGGVPGPLPHAAGGKVSADGGRSRAVRARLLGRCRDGAGKKTVFSPLLIPSMIVLPRQARDKQRGNPKKAMCVLAGCPESTCDCTLGGSGPDDETGAYSVAAAAALCARLAKSLLVCENGLLFPTFHARNDHLTKTGSGQT